MAQFTYEGEQELVLPTLSLVVNKGDSFEAPDDFSVAGVVASNGSKKPTSKTVADAPVVDAPADSETI